MRPRQVSDQDILDAARACFIEHGPGVSVSVIALKLGVSQPAVFKRFGSKRALMLAALAPPALPLWVAALADGPDERPFEEQLAEVAGRAATFFRELSPRLSVLRASGIPPEEILAAYDTPPPIAALRALTSWLKRCHRKGLIRRVKFEMAAMAILGGLHYPTFLIHVIGQSVGHVSPKAYTAQAVDLFARGLAPAP